MADRFARSSPVGNPEEGREPSQEDVFVEGEADRWFERNARAMTLKHRRPSADLVIHAFEQAELEAPRAVLDVGASNGWRLQYFHDRFGSECHALEPSGRAIADGLERFSYVRFHQGVLQRIPIAEDHRFDLVLCSFVLHWVGRESLMRSCAEIDRMLCDGGVLILSDFCPASPTANPYHHLPDSGVLTYKQDYERAFLSTHLYADCYRRTAPHDTACDRRDAYDSRSFVSVLRKDLRGLYRR